MNRKKNDKLIKDKKHNDSLVIAIIGILIGILIVFLAMSITPSKLVISDFINRNQANHIVKIIFSAIAGGVIGFEREHKNRPAGLRTHALVSIGATMVMIIPIELAHAGMEPIRMDVTRLGAQVISGIGFLGAGTIIRNGESVKGLTTAASLWVSAIIGLTIGAGNYMTSFMSLLIVIFILKIFGIFGHPQGLRYKKLILSITMNDLPQQINILNNTIKSFNLKLQKMEVPENSNKVDENGNPIVKIRLLVRCHIDMEEDFLIAQLKNIPGIIKVKNDKLANLMQ